MTEKSIPLPLPWGGLSEHEAFGEQPADTAREFTNMRCQDPRTGRRRIAQRSGLSKMVDTVLGGAKCSDLASLFVDNRQVTYSAIASGSETITWATTTPSKVECRNVKTDRQGNVYALDGNAGVVKYSADGTKLWQLALPVKDPLHVLRGLFVDELDAIYVSVSEGGNQATACFWRIDQVNDNQTEIAWEIQPGSYTEDMVVYQGRLHTIQNDVTRRRSWVRIYANIDSANPVLDKEFPTSHPLHSLAVKADGSIVLAKGLGTPGGDFGLGVSPVFKVAAGDPQTPSVAPTSVDWTPRNLTNYDSRVWGWWCADDIEQSDVAGDMKDGVEILTWRDRTKNGRHWFANLEAGHDGPGLRLDGLSGHKCLSFTRAFNGTNEPMQGMRTDPNYSVALGLADGQRSAIPSYTDSQWCIVMVLRPSKTTADGGHQVRWIFGQDRGNTSAAADDHILFLNRTSASGANQPGTGSAGLISMLHAGGVDIGDEGQGGGSPKQPLEATFDNVLQGAIVTVLYDGGLTPADTTTTRCLFQMNGKPIDRFEGEAHASLFPTYLGTHRLGNNSALADTDTGGYLGEIYEIIVFDRSDRLNPPVTANLTSVLTHDALETGSTPASQTINELTQVVGYLAHKYGMQFLLPSTGFPHPFARSNGPPAASGGEATQQEFAYQYFPHVAKYSPDGRLVWVANRDAFNEGTGGPDGGYGDAVAVNPDGNIYSIGPTGTVHSSDSLPPETQVIRMIVDLGATASISSGGAWSTSIPSGTSFDNSYPKIDVDEFGNLYLPFYDTDAATASFRVYKKDGTLLHSKLLSASQKGYAVACDRRIPDYRTDLDASVKRCEHVIVATDDEGSITNQTVHKVRLVSATQSGATPRTLTLFGVSAGNIKKFTSAAVSTPTNGTGALDSTATYIQSTTLYKKPYWTDGRQVKTYDSITDTVSNLVCSSAGSVPTKCQLIDSWRGRLVLARSADEPHNWFLSKKDEPTNWDFFPPTPLETDAVAGNNSEAGLCPDIINAIVPYSEDILVFGCDHSLWMLVGDPAAGGRLELVSDITGMSFGRPWCKDPNGVLYFFGSKGGVFRWVPGARPERVSLFKIERSLQDINLGTHYVRLAYNYKDEGIHILLCPFGAGGTQVTHYFLELKGEAFAKDLFGTTTHTNVQPTAVHVIDGDEFDDRLVLFGCEDGYVRKWDAAAKSDDTRTDLTTKIAIDSFATIGPIQGPAEMSGGLETQFHGLTVILSDQDDGAKFELYAAEEADSIGAIKRSGHLVAGRNPPKWDRVVGPHCWVRLRNAAQEERWALERAYLYGVPAGMVRPRG